MLCDTEAGPAAVAAKTFKKDACTPWCRLAGLLPVSPARVRVSVDGQLVVQSALPSTTVHCHGTKHPASLRGPGSLRHESRLPPLAVCWLLNSPVSLLLCASHRLGTHTHKCNVGLQASVHADCTNTGTPVFQAWKASSVMLMGNPSPASD